ncbi:MAG: hypothetical protein ABIZ56_01330 [Chthoniobacteraceae bacterium]
MRFISPPTSNIYGGDAHRVKDLIADPRVKRRMAGHLHNLCNTSFSKTYLEPWIDHYNAVAREELQRELQELGWARDARSC